MVNKEETIDLSADMVFRCTEGEGPLIGKPSIFMRLSTCNLRCRAFKSADSPNGCDSYISWKVRNPMTFEEIFKYMEDRNYINDLKRGYIFKYTGGEPTVFLSKLEKFTDNFIEKYNFLPRIDFETNATILPSDNWLTKYKATFTTSPKLTTNGDPETKTYKPEVLRWHSKNGSAFKFVITCSEDIDEIWRKYVDDKEGINVTRDRIWFMPCAGSRAEHIERAPAVAEYSRQMGVNFSPRLHLLMYDMALGV